MSSTTIAARRDQNGLRSKVPPPTSEYGPAQRTAAAALEDLRKGLAEWRLWQALAWLDIKQRYRRAVLGPFWITISMGVLVTSLGVLYAGIFGQDPATFLPYLGCGFIVWFFLSATVSECCTAFMQAESFIKHGGMPLSMHIYRTVLRNLLVAAHNFVVVLVIYLFSPSLISWKLALFFPGLVLVLVNLVWVGFLVGILCTRFRDLPPIVSNALQICFFISPIMYKPSSLPPEFTIVLDLNPLFYVIEALRAPLLGEMPRLEGYIYLALAALVGWALTIRFYRSTRPRIAYWL